MDVATGVNHCSFVLLAEFDIFEGAQLKYQFPQPLGIDEGVLAMSMLPDGAETQLDDWTVFFLNQRPFNTISPVLALETAKEAEKPDQELLCVLNLVRTKHDKTLDRGAKVRAMAICTKYPFIQIFKPVLLMALDDYFANPSQDCLARLFDAINSMDLSGAPELTRHEKIVMRCSGRKDIFAEKVHKQTMLPSQLSSATASSVSLESGQPPTTGRHRTNSSTESQNSDGDGIVIRRNGDKDKQKDNRERGPDRSRPSPSDASFSWVGEESGLDYTDNEDSGSMAGSNTLVSSTIDESSSSSHGNESYAGLTPAYAPTGSRHGLAKDTHFYHTSIAYKGHQLPIKMPLSTFPEEVGDYSLITLVKVFSSHQSVSGPLHPQLHTNGPQTHPIIILFNALITGKRVIFLGHKRPAGEVSSFVLAACALGSGCGVVLRGFIERAFPYANLNNRDEWESVPAYIAGVTNPIFKNSGLWDLLLDIGLGTVTVANDIHVSCPVLPLPLLGGPSLITRSGTLRADASLGSEEDIIRKEKNDSNTRIEISVDNVFIEDIRSAIECHFGESLVRMRFTEYVTRFIRLASRYEEEVTGTTKFGYPSAPFTGSPTGRPAKLGSGIVFNDEVTCFKELSSNAHRIEAWRKTNCYHYCVQDFNIAQSTNTILGFDVLHQLFRLRHAKQMPDAEVMLIMHSLVDNVKTYEQVVELLAYLVPQGSGLLHLALGLFHQQEVIREMTVDVFNQIRAYPVGVVFLQSLNHFQRYAYVRQAHALEKRLASQKQQLQQPLYATSRGHRAVSSRSISTSSTLGDRHNVAL